jgi:hypothetical protein
MKYIKTIGVVCSLAMAVAVANPVMPAIAKPAQSQSQVQPQAKINQIKPGMTVKEVKQQLGKPVQEAEKWLLYWVGRKSESVFIHFQNGKVTKVERGAG